LPDPDDLTLLCQAAKGAARIARRYWRTDQRVTLKPGDAGPVSEGDLAVDRYLRETLTAARPDYGWLSEETQDGPARLDAARVFVVDPIDGTRAYVDGHATWAHSLAVVEHGRPVAGLVYLPERGKLYTATAGHGAALNGRTIRVGAATTPDAARVLASKGTLDPAHWPGGAPPIDRHFRPSLAYRFCLVAEGRFDALITLRPAWEWDIAAGLLIAAEAGAAATDRTGRAPVLNRAPPQTDGVICAAPALQHALLARLTAGAA